MKYLKLYDERAKKWPVPSKTVLIHTSFGQTFIRISGPDNGPPLVLLHGISGNSLQWIPNVEALAKHYQVFAIDNIYDCGRSVYTETITDADDYAKWLEELFNTLKLRDPINIVGLSYGGWITSQYALRFPDRLNKIVLIAPVGTVLSLSPGWIMRAQSFALCHFDISRKVLCIGCYMTW